ncbi:hypothetical protein [Nonomuraea rhodomycinica]|uniref:Uncharacterized protein n=1 Tax=Nonomuraea rhodomycinica TaxID=1712872 RepID=A0A7Y6ME61_9ACTN|nr:hypothetical protein [Nonomuraea rhodomycinica]NUW43354.1 hypothetical protein [Nonomuraea rhodomycinica]
MTLDAETSATIIGYRPQNAPPEWDRICGHVRMLVAGSIDRSHRGGSVAAARDNRCVRPDRLYRPNTGLGADLSVLAAAHARHADLAGTRRTGPAVDESPQEGQPAILAGFQHGRLRGWAEHLSGQA